MTEHSHRCSASGCPMAGAMSDGPKSSTWWCAYHKACPPLDLARVTSVLNEHRDLRDIINSGRTLLASTSPEHVIRTEWARMRSLLEFAGYTDPNRKGRVGEPCLSGDVATFSAWIYRCEMLLGEMVGRAMGSRRKLL